MKASENDFARSLTTFLGQYLPAQSNASPHTVAAYRDTFKLFLRYCQSVHEIRPDQLRLNRLTRELVLGFLDWLEAERQNSIASRNQRLAALRAFCLYVQPDLPEYLDEWQDPGHSFQEEAPASHPISDDRRNAYFVATAPTWNPRPGTVGHLV